MLTKTSTLREAMPCVVTDTLPGPKGQAILNRRKAAIPDAIKSVYPLVIERGEGAMMEDVDGNIFLDWVGGVGVLNVGYSQPALIEAVKSQADKFFHSMMNISTHEPYIELAEKLNAIMPTKGDVNKTMLANSGAEAVENAVKMAKGYTKRPNIIVFSGAFHGRTQLTMTMTAKKAYAKDMGPLANGVYRAEFPYLYRAPKGYTEAEAVDFYVEKLNEIFIHGAPADEVAAIIVEPVQGEGGFVPAPFEWVKAVRRICDEHGIMFIADEVQTGFARSGKMFVSCYWEEMGCPPDIITSAKSIAGGMPISAVTARAEIVDGVPVGTIGGTYCGNAVACVAALKTIEVIEEQELCQRAMAISTKCFDRFNAWKDTYEVVGNVRGIGTMMGVEFVIDKETKKPNTAIVGELVQACLKEGLIIESAGTYGNVVRFLSPLVVTDEQLDKGLDIFEKAIAALA